MIMWSGYIVSNEGCWRSNALYEMQWLYDEMKQLVINANKMYFDKDPVFKNFIDNSDTLDYNIWTNVNEVGSSNVIYCTFTQTRCMVWDILWDVVTSRGNWKSNVYKSSKTYYLIVIQNHHSLEKLVYNQKMVC